MRASLVSMLLLGCAGSPCTEQQAQDIRAECAAQQLAIVATGACNGYTAATCPGLVGVRQDCAAKRERWAECR